MSAPKPKAPCTQESHAAARLDWPKLVRARRWSDVGLEIADCPQCGSTLSRGLEPAR